MSKREKANFDPSASLFEPLSPDIWEIAKQATIYPGDIYQPWRSPHGFPVTAARLAAHQKLTLYCREDEIFDLIAQLNKLLNQAALNQAYKMLQHLEEQTLQKLVHLIQTREQLSPPDDNAETKEKVEQNPATPPPSETVTNRVAHELSPDQPTEEITGLREMLARFEGWLATLEAAKAQGFRVVVQDRRRQPTHPVLHARRNETIVQAGKPVDLKTSFLLPTRYHLTLWAYVINRNDQGQSLIWN